MSVEPGSFFLGMLTGGIIAIAIVFWLIYKLLRPIEDSQINDKVHLVE